MITSELLKKTVIEQREIFLKIESPIKRDVLNQKEFDEIRKIKEAVIITGVRRCGKSYLMRLIWQKLKNSAAKDNFLYINFEDEKMLNFKAKDFDLLFEVYLELFEVNQKEKIYLFFDEIQNVKGWEKFINQLLEKNSYKIFITGSNAALLSKEIGTALTGRNYPINLYPLSFREFVNYKFDYKLSNQDFYKTETRVKIKKLFSQYLKNGGFPEVVLQNFRPILQEYLKNIIYRDIVSRYKIKNEASLREIVSFSVSNIGTILSLEKISKMTKIKNLSTIKNYLSHLEDSFLFYLLPKFSYFIKTQIYNPKKIYTIDTGMYNEIAFSNSANEGMLLENLALIELKRRNQNIFYFFENKECDFVIQEKNKITQAIQVTKIMQNHNKDREVDGLLSAMDKYDLKWGLILTEDQEDEIKLSNKIVYIKPVWRWLLAE